MNSTATLMLVLVLLMASCLIVGKPANVYLVYGSTAPSLQWEHEYAGDYLTCLIQTSDGGYAFGGISSPKSGYGVPQSTILVKTNSSGEVEWQNQYFYSIDSSFHPDCLGLIETSDRGYVFAEPDNATSGFMLLKLNASGTTQWNRTLPFGGCSVMISTSDGGFAFAGTTGSENPVVWLTKTDSVGNVQWYEDYDEKFDRGVTHLIQTWDGCYLMTGSSITDPYLGGSPSTLVLLKTDSIGNLLWSKNYNINMSSWNGHSIIQTSDNKYVIMDNTNSSVAIFKVDQNGAIEWTQHYSLIGMINSLVETSDGGLAFAGTNGNVNPTLRMAKADSLGNIEWIITGANLNAGPFAKFGVGVLFYTSAGCIIESSDGSLVVAGNANAQNFYQRSIYLIKSQQFLPASNTTNILPNVPSSLPSQPTIQDSFSFLVLTVIIVGIVIVVAVLSVYFKKRKH